MESKQNIKALVNFRLAIRSDLVQLKKLNYGLEYWVLESTGKTLCGKHIINKQTDVDQLNLYFKKQQVYVLVDPLVEPLKIVE